MTNNHNQLTSSQRTELLEKIEKQEGIVLHSAYEEQLGKIESSTFHENYMQVLNELYDQYETTLQNLPITRCSITGDVVYLKIDTYGLDGSWWNNTRAIRPVQSLLPSVFAYTGAVNLNGDIPKTSFEVYPGPGAPFIVPRLMHNNGMKAVISHLIVGGFDAYAIFYFHHSPPLDIARINWWGMNHYVATAEDGEVYSLNVRDFEIDFDFNIASYIERGQLFWIAPGDKDLQLRSTLYDCPYLDVPGVRHPIRLKLGQFTNSLVDEGPIEIEAI